MDLGETFMVHSAEAVEARGDYLLTRAAVDEFRDEWNRLYDAGLMPALGSEAHREFGERLETLHRLHLDACERAQSWCVFFDYEWRDGPDMDLDEW